jgi:predicted O-linked N-acetylglucosamine transferase (SPINDLY family)
MESNEPHPLELEKEFEKVNVFYSGKEFPHVYALLINMLTKYPDHPRVLHALGVVACEKGDFDEAADFFTRVLTIDPSYALAYNSMGNLMKARGFPDEARKWYVKSLEVAPDLVIAMYNISLHDFHGGRMAAAVENLTRVIELQPENAVSIFYLGLAKMRLGECDDAIILFEKAVDLNPFDIKAWANAIALNVQKFCSSRAEELSIKGLAANPENPVLLDALGIALLEQGRVSEAIDCYKRGIAFDPSFFEPHTHLMFAMNYDPNVSQEDIHSIAVNWGMSCDASSNKYITYSNLPDPDRTLRIGYVSADFNKHPVSIHFLPVIYHHDRSKYRIYCYYNSFRDDEITKELSSLADNWRVIANMNDVEAAELIRSDEIDILVDLSGHTAMNRLHLFAKKPVPVQATWLGYSNTTGLPTMDYFIGDDATIFAEEEHLFSEKVIRLPWSRFCFAPYADIPDATAPPCIRNGYITFGSFNSLAKLNSEVVALWARILEELPGTRLILKRGEFADTQVRNRFYHVFSEEGIDPSRLDLRGYSSHDKMLSEYGDVDIALDPFPFSGGITTLNALLMGVPVVTLSGSLPISRQTRTFYRVLNHLEFVARTKDRYCSIARELSNDIGRLEKLRVELRPRLINSYLCDGREFTRNLENIYHKMWLEWCNKRDISPEGVKH